MATLFDSASLVMIPSGVKEDKLYSIKPTDGSGDFTFSRGSDIQATRVNSSGLIEKTRVNRALYSQDFDNAAWVKANVDGVDPIVTPNYAAAPDGTQTAARFQLSRNDANGSYSQVYQFPISVSVGNVYTWSVYLKSLSGTPTISIIGNSVRPPVTLTNEWVRYSGFGVATNPITQGEIAILGSNYSAGNSLTADFLAWGYQFQEGTAPSEYIKTEGSIVYEGITADLPRLDYSGGASCPSLLLEPSRTNLITQSEYIGSSVWTKTDVVVTDNDITSPDGSANAASLTTNNAAGSIYRVYNNTTGGTDTTNTISAFFKYENHPYVFIVADSAGLPKFAIFNVQDGTIEFTSSGCTSTIEPYSNGWYRCTLTGTIDSANNIQFGLTGSTSNYAGTSLADGKKVYFWGVQREYNVSYATSYIPTYGTAANRGADSCSKTGISSLIGQTEGTLFAEVDAVSLSENRRIMFTYEDGNNFIMLTMTSSNTLRFLVFAGGAIQTDLSTPISVENVKIAGAYKANDFVLYVNGTQVGSDTNGSIPTTSDLYLGVDLASALSLADGLKQALLFKTRLTNAELAALTTI